MQVGALLAAPSANRGAGSLSPARFRRIAGRTTQLVAPQRIGRTGASSPTNCGPLRPAPRAPQDRPQARDPGGTSVLNCRCQGRAPAETPRGLGSTGSPPPHRRIAGTAQRRRICSMFATAHPRLERPAREASRDVRESFGASPPTVTAVRTTVAPAAIAPRPVVPARAVLVVMVLLPIVAIQGRSRLVPPVVPTRCCDGLAGTLATRWAGMAPGGPAAQRGCGAVPVARGPTSTAPTMPTTALAIGIGVMLRRSAGAGDPGWASGEDGIPVGDGLVAGAGEVGVPATPTRPGAGEPLWDASAGTPRMVRSVGVGETGTPLGTTRRGGTRPPAGATPSGLPPTAASASAAWAWAGTTAAGRGWSAMA